MSKRMDMIIVCGIDYEVVDTEGNFSMHNDCIIVRVEGEPSKLKGENDIQEFNRVNRAKCNHAYLKRMIGVRRGLSNNQLMVGNRIEPFMIEWSNKQKWVNGEEVG